MVACDVAHRDRGGLCYDASADKRKLVGRIIMQLMAARLRLQQEGEGRVAGYGDFFDRVHLDGDAQHHGDPKLSWGTRKADTPRRFSQA